MPPEAIAPSVDDEKPIQERLHRAESGYRQRQQRDPKVEALEAEKDNLSKLIEHLDEAAKQALSDMSFCKEQGRELQFQHRGQTCEEYQIQQAWFRQNSECAQEYVRNLMVRNRHQKKLQAIQEKLEAIKPVRVTFASDQSSVPAPNYAISQEIK